MSLQEELKELEQKLADPEVTKDYKKAAEISKRMAEIQRALNAPTPSGRGDNVSEYTDVIVEIRAGAGGDEAALFATELFEMYKKYAVLNGWRTKTLDYNMTSIGGYKQVVFEVSGKSVLEKMSFESGVHRVQRVPETEKSGRVHTSTATVAVLPKARETDFIIKPDELEISFYRSGGPGGQNVNKVSTAVRLIHKPSGLTVSSQEERSQAANKERALEVLRSKLLDIKKRQETGDIEAKRRSQIGDADRSEKIRTYNFPQDRITDHRVKKSWSNIEKILAGNLDPITKALKTNLKTG